MDSEWIKIPVTTSKLITPEGLIHLSHIIFAALTIVGLHITGDLYDSTDKTTDYWSGSFWGGIVGFLGFIAMFIFLSSVILQHPRKMLKYYYLIAAFLTFTVASFGLGLNKHVQLHNECTEALSSSEMRCDYGFLINRFIIYIISILHVMMYIVSLSICTSTKGNPTIISTTTTAATSVS